MPRKQNTTMNGSHTEVGRPRQKTVKKILLNGLGEMHAITPGKMKYDPGWDK